MNYSVSSDVEHGYQYVVVAKSSDGLSGLSNYINPADFAGAIPNTAPADIPTYNITNAIDTPMYAEVIMADGTVSNMLINYHGAHIYEEEDGTIYVSTTIYNTNLYCGFRLTGITVDDFVAAKDEIKDKMDQEAAITDGALNNISGASLVPTSEEDDKNDEVEGLINETLGSSDDDDDTDEVEPADDDDDIDEVEPADDDEDDVIEPADDDDEDDVIEPADDDDEDDVIEPADDDDEDDVIEPADDDTDEIDSVDNSNGPTTTVTPEGRTSKELYEDALKEIEARYNDNGISISDINTVLYANTSLEAYIAYALTARMEVIPIPLELFPEATNANVLYGTFFEAYRQNPTSGVICDYEYAFDYECLMIKYADDTDRRFSQTSEELEKAKEIADTVCNSSMNDAEKVYALNQYFCDNASYDFDSASTDVDMNSLTESFIDAHTPYGILCNNYGVCESYSEAMILAGRFAGVNVIGDFGYLNGGPHEWNRVCINGEYYILDVTNDDMQLAGNALCLVSDKQAPCLSSNNSAFYFDAKAIDESKEYYSYMGWKVDTKAEAIELIEEQLDQNGVANVRLAYDGSENAMMEVLRAVYEDGYDLDRYNLVNGVVGVTVK